MPEISKKYVPAHMSDKTPNPKLLKFVRKVTDRAAGKIKGIYIQPSYLEASYASLEEIRNALLDFKESGKFILDQSSKLSLLLPIV